MTEQSCRRVSAGADEKANRLWGGGALELHEHVVLLDAARDDDGGGDTQAPLAREIDLLDRFLALQLLDLKRVAIEAAGSHTQVVSDALAAIDSKDGGASWHT